MHCHCVEEKRLDNSGNGFFIRFIEKSCLVWKEKNSKIIVWFEEKNNHLAWKEKLKMSRLAWKEKWEEMNCLAGAMLAWNEKKNEERSLVG